MVCRWELATKTQQARRKRFSESGERRWDNDGKQELGRRGLGAAKTKNEKTIKLLAA
jgi:hypothetical protein